MKRKKKKEKNTRVSEKISLLRHEGVPQNQAIAESMSMERAGRLGRHGQYHRVGKKRSKRSSRRS